MTPHLFDPAHAAPGDWPEGDSDARRYLEGIAAAGIPAMVSNVRTQWRALRVGDRALPVTVNDGELGDSYVCLPHSAYALYARQELDLVDVGPARPVYKLLIAAADRLLRAADINRILHVDNWLLSTNLHGDWDGAELPAIRTLLATQYPAHIVAIRSLDDWSCPALLDTAKNDGWLLMPSRQIWVTDKMRDWRASRSAANDRRKVRQSGLVVDELAVLHPGDAMRIAELYRMLYLGKYSPLNPVFTAAWIEMTHASGTIVYRGARDAAGVLMAVSGTLVRGGIATTPVVGYDMTRPQSDGLYRIATVLLSQFAEAHDLRLNGSAGAADFKRHRGAHGVIEYSAFAIDHLPRGRRVLIRSLAWLLDRVAVPMMQRLEL